MQIKQSVCWPFNLNCLMDTITHVVLGACIGEVIAGRQLGKKALLLGALAQNIPDIDFLASFWMPTTQDLLAHRGITHSFLFLFITSPLLAWLSVKVFTRDQFSTRQWLLFWSLQVFIHIFIDAFNVYGTGWFEPFSHYRVSFNTMYVADPLFSIWPAIVMIALIILSKTSSKRLPWSKVALALSAVYLITGIIFKLNINKQVTESLARSGKSEKRFFATPTPLNNLLWYIVVQNDSGFDIGYRSILDHKPGIDYHFTASNPNLIDSTINKTDLSDLQQFSDGFYTIGKRNDSVVFNVLRFGEIQGWTSHPGGFVFYYYLQYPANNKLIVQRGRVAGWNKMNLTLFINRILE